ncbi:dephospho-CoA kinase [Oceanivirga salmonicida]|uniref:dephospho-CoA kinase n=1 Tax=Oceanivirga salmonicida TaxID=1769291 RepID=UPI0012E22084|nr:dephospho-CoA kinase [Oceanivirga salmonicida]
MIYGLTGGIATGKSTILNELKKRNIKVVDLDNISHELLENKEIKNEILKKISKNILTTDNKIDRKKLSSIVFSDKDKLEILNNIMHKKIINQMINIIKNNKDDILVIEVPLLFELNLEKYFDKIILAYAPRQLQLERILKRDKKTIKEAENILNSQFDIEIKKEKSDIIIDSSNSIEKLREQIEKEF